ncbi:SgcJ/EcaC family oxidoreductase [Microvirga sp. 3-52]|uniref:YybH family protein n=1 Tax=Microvirga sp. 3-52 TaxID=2792425 RepID=UPI001AC15CD8|nr:SgcJ/EcaC family oxidoreductase [Microvirga sp. 3-52]MBO1906332.1 SgcJ/EcaC family oxidoreductase [Microvirga sp. 3-52]MBS7453496.1 SgcJ/EcaC family oxidoreductase [Microvirga sp. 3-52]
MRILTLVTAICLSGSAPAMAQDKATIQSLSDKFAQAFNAGDAAGVATLYTDEAVILPPGAEMMKGRTAIQAFWKGAAEQLGNGKLTTVEVKSLGPEAAQEIGTFSFRTKGSQPQEISGKYVVIWEKVGSDWKLATDIWNTNK